MALKDLAQDPHTIMTHLQYPPSARRQRAVTFFETAISMPEAHTGQCRAHIQPKSPTKCPK